MLQRTLRLDVVRRTSTTLVCRRSKAKPSTLNFKQLKSKQIRQIDGSNQNLKKRLHAEDNYMSEANLYHPLADPARVLG